MKNYILEACVDSVESAIAAEHGGATRLELCANLVIGGTTPSRFLFEAVKEAVSIPIHVLIRPRFGDFCYSTYEFEIIKKEVSLFEKLGADAVVIGILRTDGNLDILRLQELKKLSRNMSITLHRAFDVCKNPKQALEEAVSLGFDTILTSGQENSCVNGANLLTDLVEQSAGRIVIQVGGGVSASVIQQLYPITKSCAYHMSGKIVLDSKMQYRKENVNMGLSSMSEYDIWRTDEQKIRKAKEVLEVL